MITFLYFFFHPSPRDWMLLRQLGQQLPSGAPSGRRNPAPPPTDHRTPRTPGHSGARLRFALGCRWPVPFPLAVAAVLSSTADIAPSLL